MRDEFELNGLLRSEFLEDEDVAEMDEETEEEEEESDEDEEEAEEEV